MLGFITFVQKKNLRLHLLLALWKTIHRNRKRLVKQLVFQLEESDPHDVKPFHFIAQVCQLGRISSSDVLVDFAREAQQTPRDKILFLGVKLL